MLTFLFHTEDAKQKSHRYHKIYTILMVATAVKVHQLTIVITLSRLKQSPLQAWTDPEGSGRLGLPNLKTGGTRRW